nr:9092_t:CDS:2 [Entrophospora candida]
MSPTGLSPDSSQAGSSNFTTASTNISRNSSMSTSNIVKHQKHLQNAFEVFEKSFSTSAADQKQHDITPPPSHTMAMVVSDEQIRSLTECLLALSPPKKIVSSSSKRISNNSNEMDHSRSTARRILSNPSSPGLPPQHQQDAVDQPLSLNPYSTASPTATSTSSRLLDYKERRSRRFSSGNYGASTYFSTEEEEEQNEECVVAIVVEKSALIIKFDIEFT